MEDIDRNKEKIMLKPCVTADIKDSSIILCGRCTSTPVNPRDGFFIYFDTYTNKTTEAKKTLNFLDLKATPKESPIFGHRNLQLLSNCIDSIVKSSHQGLEESTLRKITRTDDHASQMKSDNNKKTTLIVTPKLPKSPRLLTAMRAVVWENRMKLEEKRNPQCSNQNTVKLINHRMSHKKIQVNPVESKRPKCFSGKIVSRPKITIPISPKPGKSRRSIS